MKMLKSKKGELTIMGFIGIVVGAILIWGAGGLINFVFFTNKTPLILGGIFLLLIMFRRSKRK